MEIVSVDAIPVEVPVAPLEEDDGLAPYVSNHDEVWSVDRMFIRVETANGTVGWGEMLVTLKSPAATTAIIEHVIAPEIVGRSVTDIQEFVESFYFPYVKIDPFVGCVEMALWDAYGKQLDAPVHELLGGKTRDAVPVAYCVGILPPQESAEHARTALEKGFSALKTKAGHDWKDDVDRLTAMHDAVDGKLEFRLDPNQGWTFEDAVRAVASLEDAGVFLQYIEQPVRIESYGTYRQLRSRVRTPIGVNEDTYFRRNLYHLLSEDAIDVGVVDIVPAGGILRTRGLASMAAEAGVSLSHHCGFDLGVKTAAMLHTVSSTPGINLPPDTVYYAWDDYIIENPMTVENGEISVPDGPGLGVTVDESKIEKYRIDA